MSNFKTKCIFFFIFFLLSVNILLAFMPIKNNPVNGIVQEPTFPKLSNQNINITTPENKTYTSPMEGYYPAKYGFEDESIGTTSTSIGFVDAWNGVPSSASIESEIGGHKNVLREEYSGGAHGDLFHYFDNNHSSGIFEFWFRTTNPSAVSQFLFMEGGVVGPHPQVVSGYFNYFDGSQHSLVPCNRNQWYHLKFEWFANNTFDWYVNGKKILDGGSNLNTMTDGPDRIRLTTYAVNTNYFDAFGNSWDQEYDIGDNHYAGLLLNFRTNIDLNWTSYSLDGQTNRTILGNSTIVMPGYGLHIIQVFSNDSLGAIYQSAKRYFTIALDITHIDIKTPENVTYTSPMEGYYPAKYGFEDESIGITSTSIGFVDAWNGAPSSVSIESEIGGHKNVLREQYSGGIHGDLFHYFDNNHSSGIFEFWFRTINPSATSQFLFMEGGVAGPHPQVVSGYFNYFNGSQHSLVPCNPNQWYHLKFEWFANNTFDWYINGTKILDGGSNLNTMTDGPDRIRLTAYGVNTQYFDAFGNSWDQEYDIGDNHYEGLLLNFSTNTGFNWIGYSLDGQTNRTILSKSVIVMPGDGLHTIQVFGKEIWGPIRESEIRHFSVDTGTAEITIISPSQNEFFGSTAPNFNIFILKPNITEMWYSLDSGTTNITFSGLTGTINQTEWDKKGTELIMIKFYANDTWGFVGHADVVVNKDITAPTSLISFTPHSGTNTVIGSTLFTITANDGTGSGVSIIRYSINNSGWMDYSIPFSLSGRSAGDYLISYQAIDAVNNVETINSIVVELIEITSGPPEIPGYNIVILFGIICVISVTLLKKRYNNIK